MPEPERKKLAVISIGNLLVSFGGGDSYYAKQRV
jgi:hypothetical protein